MAMMTASRSSSTRRWPASHGRCDALFNNGGYGQVGAVEDLPVEALRAQFEANFFGWHQLTQFVLPVMRAQGQGRIVQCSSILGLVPMRFRGAYNASKHALEGFSVTLALELEGSGIHVSLIEPGAIDTQFRANALAQFHRSIDIENSVHRDDYRAQLRRLDQALASGKRRLGPEAVHKVLRHALTAKRPRYHYLVTQRPNSGLLHEGCCHRAGSTLFSQDRTRTIAQRRSMDLQPNHPRFSPLPCFKDPA
jgi:NAD(P)-dependent dehydrogenase (short-subunit alcohol dehydrogenase family)